MCTKKSAGMTLTELLVVIGIIGILASILLPATKSVRVKATESACKAEIRDIESACRSFHEDFGFYPPDTFGTSANTYTNSSGQKVNGSLVPLLRGAPARSDILRPSDDIAGPEETSIQMVFFLGSEFKIGGKSFGPYCEFKKGQLVPHPDNPNWQGRRYPAKGIAATNSSWDIVYGYYGWRGTVSNPIPWEIRGVDDDAPGVQVRLFQYLDKFGPPRYGNYRYFDYYVYDCHDPEGWQVYGPEPQPPDHNAGFVDISCYGYDGGTSISIEMNDGSSADLSTQSGQSGDEVSGSRGKELRGMWKDDINNWTTANEWPDRRNS